MERLKHENNRMRNLLDRYRHLFDNRRQDKPGQIVNIAQEYQRLYDDVVKCLGAID